MKKLLAVLLVLLTGCAGKNQLLEQAMDLRAELLGCQECSFQAVITADYGDELYSFTLSCKSDNRGSTTFQVQAPESIAGITGKIDAQGGKLTFDDQAVQFPLMAEGQISPISGPWVLMKTLLGGYLTSCGKDGDLTLVSIDDSYQEDALHLDIWLNESRRPVRGEIFFDGRRIVTMELSDFEVR